MDDCITSTILTLTQGLYDREADARNWNTSPYICICLNSNKIQIVQVSYLHSVDILNLLRLKLN